MAEQEPHSLSSTFPNPPSFWKEFTTDKVARYEQLRSELETKQEGDDTGADESAKSQRRIPIEELPEDLIHLQPPPEPSDGRWRVFGDHYMVCDSLALLYLTLAWQRLTRGCLSLMINFPHSKNKASQTCPPQGNRVPKTPNITTGRLS